MYMLYSPVTRTTLNLFSLYRRDLVSTKTLCVLFDISMLLQKVLVVKSEGPHVTINRPFSYSDLTVVDLISTENGMIVNVVLFLNIVFPIYG